MGTYDPKNPYFVQDVDKLCAVCTKLLLPGNIVSLTSTIGPSSVNKAYEVLQDICEFIFHMDGPQSLCLKCFKNTQSVYKFKELCNTSHSYFVKYSQHQEQLAAKANTVTEEIVVKLEIDDCTVDSAITQQQEQLADEANTVTEDTIDKLEIDNFKDDSATAQSSSSDCTESQESVKTMEPVRPADRRINCKVCDKDMKASNLKLHMRIHSGERPYKCTYCTATFITSSALGVHKNSHENIRNYICKYCGKAFGNSSHLRVHEKRHNGDRPHRCPVCEMTFTTSSSLQLHGNVHTSEKPFTCEYCAKSFNRRGTLQMHVKMHTGERPHVCSVCGKSFIQRQHLRSHLQKHENDSLQDCNVETDGISDKE